MLPRVYASWWINGYRYFLHLGVYFFFLMYLLIGRAGSLFLQLGQAGAIH